jgi:dTDP-4-dehydrorhamnose 3,5-epimerase-like enzyme
MLTAHTVDFPEHGDERGTLVAIEAGEGGVPFTIKRVFYMYGTKPGVRRGKHAHQRLRELAVAVSGSCRFLLDDGRHRAEILLDRPTRGLLLEPGIWVEMFDFSPDCVLMVLANEPYDPSEYVRDYQEFLTAIARGAHP